MATQGRKNKNKQPGQPIRVAIVGGGCAGLAAAWQLSKLPGYQIDVYEKSWRLGGKGASGRDADGRILEHGLHIWLGFYENAFRMMRECYAEVEKNRWGPGALLAAERLAHSSMREAFFPEPHIGVAVRDANEASLHDPALRWSIWSGYLPPAKGMPGEDLDPDTNPFTVENYLVRCYELLKTLMLSAVGPGGAPAPSAVNIGLGHALDPARTPKEIVDWSAELLRGTAVTASSILLQVVLVIQKLLETPAQAPPVAGMRTFQLITAILEQGRKLLVDVVATDPVLRRKLEIIDIVIAIAVGLYRNRVAFRRHGFDAINNFDYKEWLLKQGANPRAVESQFLTGIYDLTFAYQGGTERKLAAGVALRGALRMFFTYRGSMFWRMRSGMGDAVFAPLYKVLLHRNVRFHFLHNLDKVHIGPIGPHHYVTRLDFRTDGAPASLDALGAAALDDFGCWPDSAHKFAGTGALGQATSLAFGTDFEAVILAPGARDFVDLGDRSQIFPNLPRQWQDMRDNVRTAATQSAQVWLSMDLEELGWKRGSGIMTAMGTPFETWADMTHTLETERDWRIAHGKSPSPQDAARSVAYFCAVVPDQAAVNAAAAQNKAAADLQQWLDAGMQPFWPAAFRAGGTASKLRVGNPHVQANSEGSDRYTLSLPKSVAHRVSPLDRSVVNMSIAGDWTASGLDAGCVEAAVMSGMLASVAITGDEAVLNSIVGYDHP